MCAHNILVRVVYLSCRCYFEKLHFEALTRLLCYGGGLAWLRVSSSMAVARDDYTSTVDAYVGFPAT